MTLRQKVILALVGLALTGFGLYLAGWTTAGPAGALVMIPGAIMLGFNIADIIIGHESWWL